MAGESRVEPFCPMGFHQALLWRRILARNLRGPGQGRPRRTGQGWRPIPIVSLGAVFVFFSAGCTGSSPPHAGAAAGPGRGGEARLIGSNGPSEQGTVQAAAGASSGPPGVHGAAPFAAGIALGLFDHPPDPDQADADMASIAALGANLVVLPVLWT